MRTHFEYVSRDDKNYMKQLCQLLRSFGDFITAMDVHRGFYVGPKERSIKNNDIRTIQRISHHCSEPLSGLRLNCFSLLFPYCSEDAMHALSQFKQLKLLHLLGVPLVHGIPVLIEICQNYEELIELRFDRKTHRLSADDLLELVRNMPKLQHFTYRGSDYDDGPLPDRDQYRQLLEIVKSRPVRTHLTIEFLGVKQRYGLGDLLKDEAVTFIEKSHRRLMTKNRPFFLLAIAYYRRFNVVLWVPCQCQIAHSYVAMIHTQTMLISKTIQLMVPIDTEYTYIQLN